MHRLPWVLCLVSMAANAQVPNQLGYQGRLVRADGTPEAGVVAMTFSLFDVATGGSPVGCDAFQVALTDGFYSVLLGDAGGCAGASPAITASIFDGRDLHLEVAVAGASMAPRQRVGTVAYAHRSGTATNLRGGTVEATSVTVAGATGVSIDGTGIAVGGTPIVDATGKVTSATGALTSVAHGSTLTGNGTVASPLDVVATVARLSRTGNVAPGGFLELVHNFGSAEYAAMAWVNQGGAWRALPIVSGCPDCGTGADGPYAPTANTTLAGGAQNYSAFTVPSGVRVTVTGATPLTLLVNGPVVIDGILDLSGGNGTDSGCVAAWFQCPAPNNYGVGGAGGGGGGGAGGSSAMDYCLSSCNTTAPPGTACTCGSNGGGLGGGKRGEYCSTGGGGGGGGHATSGGPGSVNSAGTAPGGAGGAAYDSLNVDTLASGSGGGSGSSGGGANAAGGGAGGGGGAVKIVASSITVAGSILAIGGNGGSQIVGPCGVEGDGGGGGGGAGGAIWLRARTVSASGTVSARGGSGGSGGVSAPTGGVGGAGALGRIRIDSPSVTGTTNPVYFTGSTQGLGQPGFSLQLDQNGLNAARVYNTSGAAADLMLTAVR